MNRSVWGEGGGLAAEFVSGGEKFRRPHTVIWSP